MNIQVVNFAVNCLRALFRSEKLEGRNISGVKNKLPVDPTRVTLIRQYVAVRVNYIFIKNYR